MNSTFSEFPSNPVIQPQNKIPIDQGFYGNTGGVNTHAAGEAVKSQKLDQPAHGSRAAVAVEGNGPNGGGAIFAFFVLLVWLVVAAFALVSIAGCEVTSTGDRNLNDAGAGVGGITTLVTLSEKESNVGGLRKILKAIGDKAAEVGLSIGFAQDSMANLKHENLNLKNEITSLKDDFWSARQHRLVRWFLWALVIAALLRGLGVLSTGTVGMVASYISTGIVAICTGGISLITTIGDNIHFRKRINEAKAEAETAKANAQPMLILDNAETVAPAKAQAATLPTTNSAGAAGNSPA